MEGTQTRPDRTGDWTEVTADGTRPDSTDGTGTDQTERAGSDQTGLDQTGPTRLDWTRPDLTLGLPWRPVGLPWGFLNKELLGEP